jgi:hypothetical protein
MKNEPHKLILEKRFLIFTHPILLVQCTFIMVIILFALGVPCLTLREETEWIETVEDGWNTLVGTDPDLIAEMARTFRPKKRQQ